MEKLVRGIAGQSQMSQPDPQAETPGDSPSTATDEEERKDSSRKRPELLVRTYVASTSSSEEFGPMVAAEAQSATSRTPLPGFSWEMGRHGSGNCSISISPPSKPLSTFCMSWDTYSQQPRLRNPEQSNVGRCSTCRPGGLSGKDRWTE